MSKLGEELFTMAANNARTQAAGYDLPQVSNCCGVGPMNDVGICPKCREHCEWEDGEDDSCIVAIRREKNKKVKR